MLSVILIAADEERLLAMQGLVRGSGRTRMLRSYNRYPDSPSTIRLVRAVNPEVVMARDQDRLFTGEERTAGYGIVNVLASYTLAQKHAAHIFSVNGFNLGNKLYFNHLSFIKDIAPEIGRGVRVSYTVRFF